MKKILIVAILFLASCKKEEISITNNTKMTYRDLSDRVVNISTPAGIDISGDGLTDLWFEIWHTDDDQQNRDIHQFLVTSGESSRLLLNNQDLSPVLQKGDILKSNGFNGFAWKAPASFELAKRTLVRNTIAPTWEGAWRQADRKYLAVQVTVNGSVYNGWVELSFDTARERVNLYRSGISMENGKEVTVGL